MQESVPSLGTFAMSSTLCTVLALQLALPTPAVWLQPAPTQEAQPEEAPDDAEAAEGEAAEPDAEEGEPDAEGGEPDAEPESEAEPAPAPPPAPEELDEEMLDEEMLDDAEPADYDPARDSPEAIEARRMITGGIILLTIGTGLAAGSLAMGVSDKCNRAAGNSCSGASRNRAAATMAVPAVAIFTAGAVLLGIGMRNRNRLRADVALGREGGGVVVTGRF